MSIYSNDNISKIAKLTTRELPHLAKTAKITVRENNGVYSIWGTTDINCMMNRNSLWDGGGGGAGLACQNSIIAHLKWKVFEERNCAV